MEGPAFIENISEDFSVCSRISSVFHTRHSKFQSINVVDTMNWGRCLILDGHMQSAEKDEYVYHENLIHPVMLAHPNPKRVFVGGGGEGATIREIMRHKSVEKVVMVDIDEECVDVSKKFLPKHSNGAYNDSRLHLVINDAKAHLENNEEKFDVIVMDLADPVEGGPCKMLYTEKFYQTVKSRLSDGGFFITQAGPAGVLTSTEVFTAIQHTLAQVFPTVFSYVVHVPSFNDCWGYHIATMKKDIDIRKTAASDIDKLVEQRITGGSTALGCFDGEWYSGLFVLPKATRAAIRNEQRIITEDAPLVIP